MKEYLAKKYLPIPDFPLGIGYIQHGADLSMHQHDFIEVVLVAHGDAINVMQNESGGLTFGLIPGDVFTVMPGESHAYVSSRKLTVYNLFFQPSLISDVLVELKKLKSWDLLFCTGGLEHRKIHLEAASRRSAENCLKKIHHGFSFQPPGFKLTAKGAVLEFFTIIGQSEAMRQSSRHEINDGILKSIALLENSPEKSFQLEFLARNAGMSVSSFTRKFRDFTGVSPIDYLIRLRLDNARILLEETNLPISEIAELTGFCDNNYLIKNFRLRYGITPGKYRKLLKPENR